MTMQKKTAEEIIHHYGLVDRPGTPVFTEFVDWIPEELFRWMLQFDGGKQGSSSTAMMELLYPILIALKSGNPQFRVSTDLIKSLRDTEIPDFPMEMLRTPFDGLTVIVPRGTFESPAQEVGEILISQVAQDRFRVVFSQREYTHYINVLADDKDISIAAAAQRTLAEADKIDSELAEKIRTESMYENYFKSDIFRFAVNLMLYVTSPDADMYQDKTEQHKLHQKLQGLKGGRRRDLLLRKLQEEKEKLNYVVGANVRLQKEYTATLTASGKKWSLQHRVRVMGHWRQQPHGPEKKLRKLKWIAPHWRGPTYAEMVEKGYVVR